MDLDASALEGLGSVLEFLHPEAVVILVLHQGGLAPAR
jgi:hypothetical protein